jgi:DNA-binding response OmpR family regulator
MAGEKILVIDDEAVVRKVVEHHLVLEGYQVITAGDGRSVIKLVNAHKPDLIILDILLPDLDGIEVCCEIRKKNNVPIIFLSSKNDPSDIVLGLGVGGDDYIVKPFNCKELIARVKANLRRSQLQNAVAGVLNQKRMLSFPGLEIDLLSRKVVAQGKPVSLTNKEYELLAILAQNPNIVFSYNQLLESVWQYRYSYDYRTVMVHINRLRKKIEQNPSKPHYIITVRGIGYKFYDLAN